VSSNDGRYGTARQQLPLEVVERTAGWVFEQLLAQTGGSTPVFGRRKPGSSMALRSGRPTAPR